jgi:hypothetical protein
LQVNVNGIGPRFFETMGIPLVLGRGPTALDTASSPSLDFHGQEFG